MDLDVFCRQSRVVLVVGKGGVGKSTVTATLARAAADVGISSLVLALDNATTIPTLFGVPGRLSYAEQLVYGNDQATVHAQLLTPDEALLEYLDGHGLTRAARRLATSGVLDVVATAIPGVREVLVLGKIRQLADDHPSELLIVDAPASGHALSFLTSASGLLRVARAGPLHDQAAHVETLLREPARSQVLLVTLAEETPVNETVETAYRLEDEVGVALAGVVANAVLSHRDHLDLPADASIDPVLAAHLELAATLRISREALESEQLDRLGHDLPLPRAVLPRWFATELGPDALAALAGALRVGIGAW
jgi:anion-transporting  ArsA/GET3 family ATPase